MFLNHVLKSLNTFEVLDTLSTYIMLNVVFVVFELIPEAVSAHPQTLIINLGDHRLLVPKTVHRWLGESQKESLESFQELLYLSFAA